MALKTRVVSGVLGRRNVGESHQELEKNGRGNGGARMELPGMEATSFAAGKRSGLAAKTLQAVPDLVKAAEWRGPGAQGISPLPGHHKGNRELCYKSSLRWGPLLSKPHANQAMKHRLIYGPTCLRRVKGIKESADPQKVTNINTSREKSKQWQHHFKLHLFNFHNRAGYLHRDTPGNTLP